MSELQKVVDEVGGRVVKPSYAIVPFRCTEASVTWFARTGIYRVFWPFASDNQTKWDFPTHGEVVSFLKENRFAEPVHDHREDAKVHHPLLNAFEELDEIGGTDIPNGTFTLRRPDGTHRTFRVRTQREDARFAPGRRIIGFLSGPDNTSNYTWFGFVDVRIVFWRRFLGRERLRRDVELLEAYFNRGEGHVDEARSCLRCNRLLTTPESISRGIGPECAERV